ncbi:MAG: prepilin peptidase [Hyphomicrobiales bacterium]
MVRTLELPVRRSATPAVAVALALAALSVAAATQAPSAGQAVAIVAAGGLLAWIAANDVVTLRAPNRVVYPAVLGALAVSAAFGPGSLGDAALGGFAAFAAMFAVALLGRGAMGMGDVKVAALCGVLTGVRAVLPMLAITFVAGGLFAALLLALGIRRRKDVVAFTPFLAFGVLLTLAAFDGYLVR